ncbi:MAG: leucyl/phenylalanyl-tRNA--protein transferase [Myxococcales bacterium]|nr:leucyl/phenylalanyl-tRNA--protein transferase [Myxococcales bacterium]
MPIYLLDETLAFPDPMKADAATGILAVGGDLSPSRLLLAYSLGIFPWYDESATPILWHSPRWRFAMRPRSLRVNRSLRKTLRREQYEVRYDTAFAAVLAGCATVPRPGQDGTWLNRDMQRAYRQLHARGFAHSAEAWRDGQLVGGLYGVTLGGAFFGESMFTLEPDASKAVYATLVPRLSEAGYTLIDCQVYTDHLARFGATEWHRRDYHDALREALALTPRPRWPTAPERGLPLALR